MTQQGAAFGKQLFDHTSSAQYTQFTQSRAVASKLHYVAAVTVVAEGIYTRTQMSETAPGRPSILPVVASTLGLVAVRFHSRERQVCMTLALLAY